MFKLFFFRSKSSNAFRSKLFFNYTYTFIKNNNNNTYDVYRKNIYKKQVIKVKLFAADFTILNMSLYFVTNNKRWIGKTDN